MTINISEYFTDIIEIFDGSLYLKDVNGIYLGCNRYAASKVGLNNPDDIVGKSDYDLFGKEEADVYRKNDLIVIQEARELAVEEIVSLPDGEKRIHLSVKRPLYSKNGPRVITGIIGYTVDITEKKEAERLRLESETQKIALQEKEKFTLLARKVAHDINSPLAALKMMIPMCTEIPENKRTLLNRATEGILDIANNLLNTYHKQANSPTADNEPRQHLLVSDLLIQLLSEKKVQYSSRPVMFKTVIADNAHFAFIKMQPIEFRRSISNLINNAVDAFESGVNGQVTVQLTADAHAVSVTIQDNGKGMPQSMVQKMLNRESFTEGKENGHGLGLQQVWATVEYNLGTMEVQSTLGKGTSIQISFPRIAASKWIAQEIHLFPDNVIVILDDDDSIHTAWDLRFTPFLTSYPNLRIEHFRQGQDVLDFLATLNHKEKKRLFFLSDYELLHQSRNGLQIVEASGIKDAVLVTSYYSNPKIREEVDRLGIKVLPKQMASIVPIFTDSAITGTHN